MGDDNGQTKQSRLRIVPLELFEANEMVDRFHRHHKPVQGHRFSIGVLNADDKLVGAAIVGRPVARLGGDPSEVVEVTRLVTDGTPNACSALYGAAARAAHALGYRRIQTYTLDTETGISLKAAGWKREGTFGGGQWHHTDGKPRRTDQPIGPKIRWAQEFLT